MIDFKLQAFQRAMNKKRAEQQENMKIKVDSWKYDETIELLRNKINKDKPKPEDLPW